MVSVSDIDRCAELVPDELIIFFDVIISRVVVPSRVRPFFPTVFFEVLKSVPHRQWVFSIPKRMRIYFMYDRKLLSALSRCAWRVLSVYLRQSVLDDSAAPGAAIAVQTFGEFQNFNPHLHAIASDGCFSDNGVFQVAPGPKPRDLEDLFRYEVLKTEGKITDAVIENMVSWRRSGFRQPQFKYRVKTVVSRRHFAVGDHVEPDKSELRFRNEFYGFDVNVRVDTPMILGTLLFGFEFEFDGT